MAFIKKASANKSLFFKDTKVSNVSNTNNRMPGIAMASGRTHKKMNVRDILPDLLTEI